MVLAPMEMGTVALHVANPSSVIAVVPLTSTPWTAAGPAVVPVTVKVLSWVRPLSGDVMVTVNAGPHAEAQSRVTARRASGVSMRAGRVMPDGVPLPSGYSRRPAE